MKIVLNVPSGSPNERNANEGRKVLERGNFQQQENELKSRGDSTMQISPFINKVDCSPMFKEKIQPTSSSRKEKLQK